MTRAETQAIEPRASETAVTATATRNAPSVNRFSAVRVGVKAARRNRSWPDARILRSSCCLTTPPAVVQGRSGRQRSRA